MVPISFENHHTLIVFSFPYRKIIICDSIRSYNPLGTRREKNIYLLAYFMFPFIKPDEWILEKIHNEDRFQGSLYDCGFHVMNFAKSAIDNVPIENDIVLFSQFKQVTAREYHIYRDDYVAD